MLFSITCIDRPDAAELRAEISPAHHAFVAKHLDRMVIGGPLTTLDGARNIGSLIVIRAADEAEARAFIRDEPYSKAGLFESIIVRRFKPVVQNPDLVEGGA